MWNGAKAIIKRDLKEPQRRCSDKRSEWAGGNSPGRTRGGLGAASSGTEPGVGQALSRPCVTTEDQGDAASPGFTDNRTARMSRHTHSGRRFRREGIARTDG